MRVHPGRDDKVVASWNGLAIAALAEAGQLLGEPSWIDAAVGAADLLIAVHLGAQDDDRLCRTSKDGLAGNNLGVLDDYGSLAEGLLVLAQVTGEVAWLQFAGMLLDITLQHFTDGSGGFFDTANDAPELIRRPKDPRRQRRTFGLVRGYECTPHVRGIDRIIGAPGGSRTSTGHRDGSS